MATEAVPLFLLTGFLGSGKTTLLARLIRDPGFADTAVVVNEFGEVGLDHALLSRGEEDSTVLLESGCLCCALNSSLQETLESLYYRRERGELPRFRRVVIETSGLADPGPIVNTLATDRVIASHYRLAAIIATVDAAQGERQLDEFPEALRQAAIADRLIVTKTDAAEPRRIAILRERLRALNPEAEIREAALGAIPPEAVLGPGFALAGRSDREADADCTNGGGSCPESEGAQRHRSHLEGAGIVSCAVRTERPVSWAEYATWVATLQRAVGERLLRVKGIVRVEDGLYAIHGVRHVFSPPAPLAAAPASLVGRIVCIAQGVSRDDLVRIAGGIGQ